jgi:DNA polymerase-3 subunit delta'
MFNNVFGQYEIKNIITNQIKNKKIACAYIFTGDDVTIKESFAIEFAKILNCEKNIYSCNNCISCKKINKRIHPDLHFINFEKQSQIYEEDIKKQKTLKIRTIKYMQKKIFMKLYEGKYKIFIVDPAEKITNIAINMLLKILEEPPKNVLIIFFTKNKELIPKTITSRFQTLFFKRLKFEDVFNWITLNYPSLNFNESKKIAKLSNGSLSIAKKIIYETFNNINNDFNILKKIFNEKIYISDIFELSKKISINYELECIDTMIYDAKMKFCENFDKLIYILDLLIYSKKLLLKNVNSRIVFDNLFINLLDFNN